MFGYRVPAPSQAMLISGGKQQTAQGGVLPFRIVVGNGAFVLPVLRKASFLTLAMRESVVNEDCVTQQGISLRVSAVIAFKVGPDEASIASAAQRFLDNQAQMDELTGQIFSGHLRSIIGSMTVEAIIRERQTLAENVLEASKVEMGNLGLIVDSLQIKSIDDKGSGYIEALSAPQRAAVNQAAAIAQSRADQAAAEARQQSDRNQAEYARQTAIARAQYQAEIDRAQQEAAQAGPLAAAQAQQAVLSKQAKVQQAVLSEQAKVAARNAELREAQLQAEVVKPAQAEAARVRIAAEAQADATRLAAEAAASSNRIALDQAMIAQLPELVRAAAQGLQGANLTVLNGAEGLNETVASMAAQGAAVLRTVLDGIGSGAGTDRAVANGRPAPGPERMKLEG